MTKWISAPPEYGIETSRDMTPHQPGTRVLPGIARAHLTIYDPDDGSASDTLPTVAELLATADPETGLISIERYVGLPLRISADALRELSSRSRVGPGYSFVTHEAIAAHAAEQAR